MPTFYDGPFHPVLIGDGRPQWKLKWDAVLTIVQKELARLEESSNETYRWPTGKTFIDIKVTTPKSGGVYRVFRVYPDGKVKLGKLQPDGKVEIILPQDIELTDTHIVGFSRELNEKLNTRRK